MSGPPYWKQVGGTTLTVGTTPIGGGVAYGVLREDSSQNIAADSQLLFGSAAAGHGLQIAPTAAATTAVPILRTLQALNAVGVSFPGVVHAFTGGATAAAGTNLFSVTLDAANMLILKKDGSLTTVNGSSASPSIRLRESDATGLYSSQAGAITFASSGSLLAELQANASFYIVSNSATFVLGASNNAGISWAAASTIAIGSGAAGNASGTLQLTNLVTTATSSTGTAAIIDGSNVLRPLTSSRRFKKNDAPWSASAGQLSSFFKLSASTWDYEDHKKRVVLDGMTLRTEGENREGVKGVLGFIAEEMHDAGLTEMLNYDADGLPYSLREHGVLAYMHAALKNHETRLAKAGY